MKITIEEAKVKKAKPQPGTPLGFGKYFTDHMFLMDWTKENGFENARIVPYLSLIHISEPTRQYS